MESYEVGNIMLMRSKKNLYLYVALFVYFFLPFIYQCIQTNLIVQIPSVDGLGIAGHIEWFDLINETLQAFLIVPLYSIYNSVADSKEKLANRIRYSILISMGIYAIFSCIVYCYTAYITIYMTKSMNQDIIMYLRLETIGFLMGHLASIFFVIFGRIGKSSYIYVITIVKVIGLIIGNFILIPQYGVNGIAYANIVTNGILDIICIILLIKYKLPKPEKEGYHWIIAWIKTGIFSGGQIFLDNIIYALWVCKMVNEVSEQGNYWIANNFIWGFLLVPIFAFMEMIRRKRTHSEIRSYFKVLGFIILFWLISTIFWKPILYYGMGIQNPQPIISILIKIVPFYIAYGISMIFDSIFISKGKTYYSMIISFVVNIGYYGIMYLLFRTGMFDVTITFICMLFGGGMIVNAVCSICLFFVEKNKKKENVKNIESVCKLC